MHRNRSASIKRVVSTTRSGADFLPFFFFPPCGEEKRRTHEPINEGCVAALSVPAAPVQ